MDDRQHPIVRLIACYARHARLTPATVSLYATGSGATYARLQAGHDITTRRAARVVQWLSDHWPDGAEWPDDTPRPDSPDGESESPSGGAGSLSPVLPPAPPVAGVPARGGPCSAPAGPSGGGDPNPRAAPSESPDGDDPATGRQGHGSRSSRAPGVRGGTCSAPPAASLKRLLQPQQSGSVTALSAGGAVPDAPAASVQGAGVPSSARPREVAEALAAWPLDAAGHIRDETAFARLLGVRRQTVYTVIGRYADDRPRAGRWPRGRPLFPGGAGSDSERILRALLATGDARFRRRRAQSAAAAEHLGRAAA